MTVEGMTLPPILDIKHADDAVATLRAYFLSDSPPPFSGSHFERFAGGGDRPETADVFTADDLVAVTMLSVSVPGRAALHLLGDYDADYQGELSALLRRLPTNLTLAEAEEEHLADAGKLWSLVYANHGVGRTKTSKLLARKRPHLLPVIDRVVVNTVKHSPRKHNFYRNLRAVLRDDDFRLVKHLAELRREAQLGDDISIIRVFDILVWMWGSGLVPQRGPNDHRPVASS